MDEALWRNVVARRGSWPGDSTAQDLSLRGLGPLGGFEYGEGNLLPTSPDLQANCCSTFSVDRAQHMSR